MFEVYDIVVLPIIVGVVELLKKAGFPDKLLPLSAVLLGILVGVVYIAPTDVKQGILVGIVLGLSASGLYSGGKTLVEKERVDW